MNHNFTPETVVNEQMFLDLLDKELVVALGCTEPIAIAYVAALAKNHSKAENITEVQVAASGNIIKNAMAVTIPGTTECGIAFATALGIVAGDADKKLEVLSGVTNEQVELAKKMVASNLISVSVADTAKKLYVQVIVRTGKKYAKVVLADEHTGVVLIEVDGQIVWQKDAIEDVNREAEGDVLNLEMVWQFVRQVETEKLELVKKSIMLNKQAGIDGLEQDYGLRVGKTLREGIDKGYFSDDLAICAMALAAAGSDARMAGGVLPVMSNSGSGNQGLCATLPVVAIGEKLEVDDEKMLRAVALSHLITIYIKARFGRLSALCGAAIAGTGASCGIVYLLGGELTQVKYTIQNMLGNVTGMLCDGAKAGCAMKVSTCVNAAVQSAIMAMERRCIQATDGIIEIDVEHSINNLCRLANQGSLEADRIILDIMLNKKGC
jgi:L-cysteine desulfidase